MSVAAAALLAACNPSTETADEADDTMNEADAGDMTNDAPAERNVVSIDPDNDPRVWLEEVEGEEALDWARSQNERTFARLQGDPRFEEFQAEALEIYQSEDRIPYGSYRDGHIYNFWQDAEQTHGLWRRATLDSYLSDSPEWDVVLDLDALSEEEGINWVWRGADCLAPDYARCMITLSDGGRDAAIRREFDMESRSFVEDGFVTPEAKGGVSWIDSDTLLVMLATDPETSTESGYPYIVRRWERGTPLEDAVEVMRGDTTDVGVWAFRMEGTGGEHHMMVSEANTFYETTWWALPDGGEPVQLPLPAKSSLQALYDGQLVFTIEEDWSLEGSTESFPQGALLSFDFQNWLDTGNADVETVFVAGPRESIGGVGATASALLVQIDSNVVGGLASFAHGDDGWTRTDFDTPANMTLGLTGTDASHDVAFLNAEGFLTPDSLYQVNVADHTVTPIKSTPERFDTEGLVVEQHEAESTDGTMIPYFVVRRADTVMDGTTPTLLYAYGGFQVSITPSYSGVRGRLWLDRGGAYVVANIRGGGEFGPAWHQAGLMMDRQRIYDDLIAVAEDMIDTGLTSPRHLGVYGGSNGGLLTGVMYTQRPDLWNAVVSA
ncbi:MAG TPA: S9 family peptidase, partial [Alphaproteobacteria bacterium]|nr:S9 family peptidase [Alphaproteobacteria bacterium]